MSNPNATVITVMAKEEPLEVVVPLMVCCVVACASNGFVCYLILTVRCLKTTTNVFVFNLCLCNILFAAVLLPLHCFYQQSLVYLYMVIITVLLYIANLTAATYERLYSITKPLTYQLVMTKKKALKISAFAYLAPLSYCILPVIWGNDESKLVHKIYLIGTLVIFLLGPLVFIIFVYIKVCVEIKKMYDYKKTLTLNQPNSDAEKSATSFCQMLCCSKDKHDNGFSPEESSDETAFKVTLREKIPMLADANHTQEFNFASNNPNSHSSQPDILNTTRVTLGRKPADCRISISQHSDASQKHARKTKTSKLTGRMKDKIHELKASMAFGIAALTYMFTWLPVVYLTFLQVMNKLELTSASLVVFSIFAIALSTFVDPFLYALLMPNFRKTLHRIARRMCK